MPVQALHLDRIPLGSVAFEYAKALEQGAAFPPIHVFLNGPEWWVADGRHRWLAHRLVGRKMILVRRALMNQGIEALKAWRDAGGRTGPPRNPTQRLANNPTSLRLAINAKCYDCVGQDADPGWRNRVGTCGCTGCPLHAVRPYQEKADSIPSHHPET